jgi:hypothetical protein
MQGYKASVLPEGEVVCGGTERRVVVERVDAFSLGYWRHLAKLAWANYTMIAAFGIETK